jgi:DNA end-binding protein Ku
MPRGVWKGDVNFGLVSIPVTLHSAEDHKDIKLHMLDKRDLSPISYERHSKTTGKQVPWANVVEGYEYQPGAYVVLTKTEIKNIHHKATHNIDILEFVEAKAIDPTLYDKPYYLEPDKKGMRTYALLREALQRTAKVGIAKVVIHSREYLSALMARNNLLVLELMRFPNEMRHADEFNIPEKNIKKAGISEKEISMAEQLITSMTEKWNPAKYTDDYRSSFLDYIMEKVRMGETAVLKEEEPPEEEAAASSKDVIDLMSLLKKSMSGKAAPAKPRTSSRRRSTKSKLKKAS